MASSSKKIVITETSRKDSIASDHSELLRIAQSICTLNPKNSLIERKLAGYRSQDKRRRPSQEISLITSQDVCKLLLMNKCLCYYCGKQLTTGKCLYRDPRQWTLDRIDNAVNHRLDNCVVACLECNLARRCRDAATYKQWRSVKITKKNEL